MPGVANTPYLTNSTLLDLDVLPGQLVIAGGGYIGLEFGQIFRRFGSEVTIIEKASRLIAHEMYARAPYTVLKNAMHIHPTVSELIPTILEELQPL